MARHKALKKGNNGKCLKWRQKHQAFDSIRGRNCAHSSSFCGVPARQLCIEIPNDSNQNEATSIKHLKALKQSRSFKPGPPSWSLWGSLWSLPKVLVFEWKRDPYGSPLKPLATCCICQGCCPVKLWQASKSSKDHQNLAPQGNIQRIFCGPEFDYRLPECTDYSLDSLTIWLIWPLIPVTDYAFAEWRGTTVWITQELPCPAMAEASAPLHQVISSPKKSTLEIHPGNGQIGQFLYFRGRLPVPILHIALASCRATWRTFCWITRQCNYIRKCQKQYT